MVHPERRTMALYGLILSLDKKPMGIGEHHGYLLTYDFSQIS